MPVPPRGIRVYEARFCGVHDVLAVGVGPEKSFKQLEIEKERGGGQDLWKFASVRSSDASISGKPVGIGILLWVKCGLCCCIGLFLEDAVGKLGKWLDGKLPG